MLDLIKIISGNLIKSTTNSTIFSLASVSIIHIQLTSQKVKCKLIDKFQTLVETQLWSD